jgi:Ca-activated chloride channel family protein
VRTVYVPDIAQSMAGARLARLKAILSLLTRAAHPASRETTLPSRDQVTIEPFSTAPCPQETLDIPARSPQAALSQIRAVTASLAAGGSTAIYDALAAAYKTIAAREAASPGRLTTIVLLTDGRNTTGRNLAAFTRFYHHLPPAAASVPVFPVLLDPASTAQMQHLATLTGGQVFNARRLPLTTILTLISENQPRPRAHRRAPR